MNDQPLFSIVTPNYNQGNYLEETLLSLINQTYKNFEIIIIDGGSTDNSLDIIKKYQKYIKFWVSEKDNGQSHAINKGIEQVEGKYFAWINSDDVLFTESLFYASQYIIKHPDTHILHSNYVQIDSNSKIIKAIKLPKQSHFFANKGHLATSQPALFYSTEFIRKIGLINEEYRLSMDIDLWMRCFKHKCSVGYINKYLGGFRVHPSSATQESIRRKTNKNDENDETKKILDHYLIKTTMSSRKTWRFIWKIYQLINLNYLLGYFHTNKFQNRNWNEINFS